MKKQIPIVLISVAGVILGLTATGCSDSAPPEKPVVLASQADILQANVARAKTILDQLEKVPKKSRQTNANRPKIASTLKAAAADPDTKKRIDDLGIVIE